MPNVIMLSAYMSGTINPIMLNAIMLSVAKLNVVVLNVMAPIK